MVGKQAQKSKVNARWQLKWWSIGFKQVRRKCQGRRDPKSGKNRHRYGMKDIGR